MAPSKTSAVVGAAGGGVAGGAGSLGRRGAEGGLEEGRLAQFFNHGASDESHILWLSCLHFFWPVSLRFVCHWPAEARPIGKILVRSSIPSIAQVNHAIRRDKVLGQTNQNL